MSFANLANLETLNDQPIKTSKNISFARYSYSSVDAIIAFLAKFNPAVESLDLSNMQNLQSKLPAISCITHATIWRHPLRLAQDGWMLLADGSEP